MDENEHFGLSQGGQNQQVLQRINRGEPEDDAVSDNGAVMSDAEFHGADENELPIELFSTVEHPREQQDGKEV